MGKFGELIDRDKPVLLIFFTEWHPECENVHIWGRHIAAVFGDDADVIKIDVDKNQDLTEALRIRGLPTLMVYSHGKQFWRKEGNIDYESLIQVIKDKLN